MNNQEPNIITKSITKSIRLFSGKGKPSVPGEESIDKVIPGEYNAKVEAEKTKNQIALVKVCVWSIGGIGALALVLAMPIYLSFHVRYLSSLLASDLKDSQVTRVETMYDNAREDRNDLVQMIIPGLLTVITVGIFNINRASNENNEG